MISNPKKRKKWTAAFFAGLLVVQNFYPVAAYALTSGPAQPEMQKFQAAGAGDMVDLFSGDFKYDIPLMDVGGYPLNLSYHSGTGIEDEATWVGAGWSLNPGAINRTMRGLPDDFTGDNSDPDPQDAVLTAQYQKPFKKIGAQLLVKPTLAGFDKIKPSLQLDIHKDNYWGIGASVGAGVNYNLDLGGSTSLTAGLTVNSDNREGVTVNPNLSLTASYDALKESNSGTLSGGFSYNTRSGLENVNLGASFNSAAQNWDDMGDPTSRVSGGIGFASLDKFYKNNYSPTIGQNTQHTSSTFSLDLGVAAFFGYVGFGASGYTSSQTNIEPNMVLPAYGYMHYAAGVNNPSALLDFAREKDGVFNTYQPAIAVPVNTPDYFVATSQAGMQQFRSVYNGNYVIYDRQYTDKSTSDKLGLSAGFGDLFQAGAQLNISNAQTVTKKWTVNNNFLLGTQPTATSDPRYEEVFVKQVGEQTSLPKASYDVLQDDGAKKVKIDSRVVGGPATAGILLSANPGTTTPGPMNRVCRNARTATFSYLTAQQASLYGLDKRIGGTIDRVDAANVPNPDFNCVRKPHHMSEVTVTDKEGKRMVYGIPVYNKDQEEVSFSTAYPGSQPEGHADFATDRRNGLVTYNATDKSPANRNGRYWIYNRKSIPPYSTSFLLTGILSPDYVDKTCDGISDDDAGSAVKFCYSRLSGTYSWRAPFEGNKANYNEGFLSDHKDDKASFVFGEKELWYLDSIRTRTLVAVFYRSPREDGLGVSDEDNSAGKDLTVRMQKLDRIALYSRADLAQNGVNAVPIKVVHFEYDYSLFPFVPNNSGQAVPDPNNSGNNLNAGQGKLTLKKVYFTFGSSSRGQTNPYQFSYDNDVISGAGNWGASGYDDEKLDHYSQRQTDRWGTYRQNYFTTPSHLVYNSDFPYAMQPFDDDPYDVLGLANKFASKWQLTNIRTPTGASISVTYESDDYSYVQDRKAMIMCPVVGFDASGKSSDMKDAHKIYVRVPQNVSVEDFPGTYLSGPDGKPQTSIFFKMMTNLDNKSAWEYVYGYAEIDPTLPFESNGSNIIGIPVKFVKGYNPVSMAAWQMIQTDLPQFAYPNYDNSDVDNLSGNVVAAVKAIVKDFANFRELFESFNDMAAAKGYGNSIDPSRSMIRLNFPAGPGVGSGTTKAYGKLGGGARVSKVEISDNWPGMNTAADAKGITYGVSYDYTIMDDQQNKISSGVASYEPEIGNEENPFREPVSYTEKVEWSNDRYHYMEKPFGESFFPSPSVGYSQVKATPYGYQTDDPSGLASKTGWIIGQFYTARDFPTQADYLPISEETYEYDLTLLLFGAKYTNQVLASQGFQVTLNDMHGKPKSVQTYDDHGKLINSTEYFYNVVDDNAPKKQLNNSVTAMHGDGSIPTAPTLIATDVDVVTDVRESKITSSGSTADANAGLTSAVFVPIPFAGFDYSATKSVTGLNTIAFMKVVHQYGVLREVRTTQNGSTLTADNLLWDAQTGDVLLTRNQNEFGDYTYNLHYPAFRAFDGMAGAYENIGTVLTALQTNADGTFNNYPQYLSPGDELVDIEPAVTRRGWVLQSDDGTLRFIDRDGNFISGTGSYMIVRSGRRNQLSAGVGSLVTMNNPLLPGSSGYTLQTTVDARILDAKAVTYKDEWGVPVPNFMSQSQLKPYDYVLDEKQFTSQYCYMASFPIGGPCSNSDFVASALISGSTVVVTRSFLDIAAGTEVDGHPISRVELTLSPVSFSGSNAAYIRRVNSPSQICSVSKVAAWLNQPSTTTSNQILLPSGPAPSQPVLVDLTAMYNEWVGQGANKDNPEFAIAIMLDDETSTNASRSMDFGGISPTAGNRPQVTVYYTDPGGCTDPVNHVLNPYYTGVKGNWRPEYTYAYPVNRDHTPGDPAIAGGTNIRSNGYYSLFTPFWNPITVTGNPASSSPTLQQIARVAGSPGIVADPRWVWGARTILYDEKGNEVENRDALKRYSSAIFGYQQSLATAVATNARHSEIAFDGFEDYFFALQPDKDPCPLPHRQLDFGVTVSGSQATVGGNNIVRGTAHTGNYSLQLGGGILNIQPGAGSLDPPEKILGFDDQGRAILLANDMAAGFAPIATNDYVLSLWVNDGVPNTKTITGLSVKLNTVDKVPGTPAAAIVEGWKLLNIKIPAHTPFIIQISGSGGIYIDDLRLFPSPSEMKTYVYDDQTLRLMAQLDENNLAVLYEYDREGTPIRVKKETEKGVMTVKENRQSLMTQQ